MKYWYLLILIPLSLVSAAAEKLNFNRDIRPILSNACFQCHGPDAAHREADLRLDTLEGAKMDLGGYQALVPGDVEASELIHRIFTDDEDELMPPEKSHKSLSDNEKALLKRWVAEGAEYLPHWSFIPVKKNGGEGIDAFIQKGLQEKGWSLSEEADKATRIRRVFFDLTGLPPTVKDLDAFQADSSPDAYEKLVDRLIASPHFGEHMARFWLDAVRYGDTHGLHLDNARNIWPYRDWVVQAFNENMPYDQFTIEQIAGDLLPDPDESTLTASGYNRCILTTAEGGVIPEEVYVRNVMDRVSTTATVWLGLTAECASCHDHKFDPISQKEYYQLFAFFNNFDGNPLDGNKADHQPVIRLTADSDRKEMEDFREKIKQVEHQLVARSTSAEAQYSKWAAQKLADESVKVEKGLQHHLPLDGLDGLKVTGDLASVPGKLKTAIKFNGKSFVDLGNIGDFERDQKFSYGCWVKAPDAMGHMSPLSKMNDGNRHRGFDIFVSSKQVAVHLIHTWADNAIKVTTKEKLKPNQWVHLFATYDGSSSAKGVKIYVDGKEQKLAVNVDALKNSIKSKVPFRIGSRTNAAFFNGDIDDVRIYNRQLSADEVKLLAQVDVIGPILAIVPDQRTKAQKDQLRAHFFRSVDEPSVGLIKKKQGFEAALKKVENRRPSTLVMKELKKPKEAFVLTRGEYDQKGEKVAALTPDFLPKFKDGMTPNRLGFAKWLVDSDHPLTSRVVVNRLWQQVFGTGLVKTAEDFGAQGEMPTHPELLDWLASDFVASGWDVKRFMKQLVMSKTYHQSGKIRPEIQVMDPENRFLARGPRHRLDAEMLRDQALAVSGLLKHSMGGPGVKPPQPAGLWKAVAYPKSTTANFVADKGDKIYRRSLYTFWKRTSPPPVMTTFDAPSRESCSVRRERTNTPLQALALMNEEQFVESAKHLAVKALQANVEPAKAIGWAFRRVTARAPQEAELNVLLGLYQKQHGVFADEEKSAALIGSGVTPVPKGLDARALASMTTVMNVLLNLDEVITKG